MDDRDRDGRNDEGKRDPRPSDRRGPEDTSWLQLELSQVLKGSAEQIARGAIDEILREAVKARLRERLGPRLESLGRAVADQIADDVEACLDIEARIDARRKARRADVGRITDAFAGRRDGGHEREPRDEQDGSDGRDGADAPDGPDDPRAAAAREKF
jgi:hypothetical protein